MLSIVSARIVSARIVSLSLLACAVALAAAAQDTQYPPHGQQIPAARLHDPAQRLGEPFRSLAAAPNTHERWLLDLDHWRTERRIRIAYDPVALRDCPRSNGPSPASCSRR